jgi:UDP-N-acetylmuramoyl-tripeptide--D-alanyl-D-alanine ligase
LRGSTGAGNLSNVLAALAVGTHFGVPLSDMVEIAGRLRPAYHRGELLRLPGGVTLIDDSYNSSPAALKRSLETVASATGSARKIAVLGEMLELGSHAERLHRDCGRAAASAGLDLLITVGGDPAAAMAREAIAAGMPDRCVSHVATKEDAADAAMRHVRPGDLVLVKGSRGIGTDAVVERLKEEFA